jgi:hypothetical protein
MAFQLSPGVNVSEFDLTTIVPSVGTTEGAIAGQFNWGPSNTVVTISNEVELADTFGRPDNNNFATWFTAANFLSYARNLKVVRAANTAGDFNATNGTQGVLIENRDVYDYSYNNPFVATTSQGTVAARYSGVLGNGLRVGIFANGQATAAWTSWTSPSVAYANQFDDIPGTSNYVAARGGSRDEMHIIVIDELGKFTGSPNTVLEKFAFVSKASDAKNDDGSSNYYVNVINDLSKYIYIINHPTISAANIAAVSVVTTDSFDDNYTGFVAFSGGSGSGANASFTANSTGYISSISIVNRGSGYELSDTVTASISGGNGAATLAVTLQADGTQANSNWGIVAANTVFNSGPSAFYNSVLNNGVAASVTDARLVIAYDKFKNAEEVDISLIMGGAASQNVAEHIVDNLAESRRDCVAFISPLMANVVNKAGLETTQITGYRDNFTSSSYAVMDSGWKYQFDKYNNVYRWVPLNGDIAGLCVRTDFERDPWYSPAGFNRGQIKNVIKLAWNPNKTARDELYKKGINPVVTFPGEGTVLYGDKTLLARPSAFDRINVRRLFIVLEKAIARAAKYSLFEFNDEFTRAQFVSLVEPYLRDVQGRRGIFAYRVVCDQTNNTPEVIDRNEFIGDIYIKPARSINFIQLNFVAVRTGVAFDEIVGKF